MLSKLKFSLIEIWVLIIEPGKKHMILWLTGKLQFFLGRQHIDTHKVIKETCKVFYIKYKIWVIMGHSLIKLTITLCLSLNKYLICIFQCKYLLYNNNTYFTRENNICSLEVGIIQFHHFLYSQMNMKQQPSHLNIF